MSISAGRGSRNEGFDIEAALRLVQHQANGERLPAVRVRAVLVMPWADFPEHYGELPRTGESVEGAQMAL